jgi:hypothetical protein
LEADLYRVVSHLAESRWPFRVHGTYEESISRFLDVFERVNAEFPLDGLHWFIDHAETVTQRNLDRIKAFGGGMPSSTAWLIRGSILSIVMARNPQRPPRRSRMLEAGIPVGQYADFVVLPEDMMAISEDDLKNLYSILTVVGGDIVYAGEEFTNYAQPDLPISPSWSPATRFGCYYHADRQSQFHVMANAHRCGTACGVHSHHPAKAHKNRVPADDLIKTSAQAWDILDLYRELLKI